MAPGIEVSLHKNRDPVYDKSYTSSKKSIALAKLSANNSTLVANLHVLNPVFITHDFDKLCFEAAASNQLSYIQPSPPSVNGSTSPALSTSLISSPYNDPGHYLDLTTLTTQSVLLAKALTVLQPTRPDYATAPYTEALNFSRVLDVLQGLVRSEGLSWKESHFYVVAFRSRLKECIDQDWLYKLDYESHREACESGGLLKYWFGKADGERRNLATCFWHSRNEAFQGGLGPWHLKARAAGKELYDSIQFSTWRFTVTDGAQGYSFEKWKG